MVAKVSTYVFLGRSLIQGNDNLDFKDVDF